MVAFLTDSEHCSVSEIDREKAWHLLAILLSIGRPACPAELSARCTLFHVSPDFVEFLCLIPDSPLFLTHDAFVTISLAAFSIFEEFASKAIVAFLPRFPLRVPGSKKSWSGVVHTYFRKRKGPRADSVLLPKVKRRLLSPFENDENDLISLSPANRIQSDSPKGHIDYGNNMIRSMNILPGDMAIREYGSGFFDRENAMAPLLLDSDVEFAKYGLKNNEHSGVENEVRRKIIMHRQFLGSLNTPAYRHKFLNIEIDSNIPSSVTVERVTASVPVLQPALLTSTMENLVLRKEAEMDKKEFRNGMDLTMTSCLEVEKWCNASLMESDAHVNHSYEAAASRPVEYAGIKAEASGRDERDLNESGTRKGDIENTVPPNSTAQMGGIHKKDLESMNLVNCDDMIISLQGEQTAAEVEIQAVFPLAKPSTAQKQQARSFTKLKTVLSDASTLGKLVLSGSLDHNKTVNSPKQPQQCKRDLISMKQKLKGNRNHNMHAKENRADPTSTTSKNHSESRELPNFESFIIEEEEGSGGYGTVYRARRKNGGKVFAIKCPHANAHTHHVNNEMKMLERFGGRNFVIKYEGSFKSGTSDCFVLEHVEHDRPEVLKREIDIFHLQWYGYCMFRALASLHKQGIVHRDVKPGNFLFSRKFNKGYLIDFNLAMDLQQKYGHNRKSKTSCCVSFDHVPIPSTKSALTTKGRKTASGRIWEAISREAAKDSKSALEPKNMKRRADVSHLKVYPDLGSRTIFRSQGADGSGITSTKDATSTKTPSAERMREPLPCQGRKELISLVQEAMQSPNCDPISVPSSQRKRVAAAPEKVDRNLFYLSPMPLHSTGVAVAGAGLLKKKGDGKHKREGPCVGTKGFRAPEVLFKSPHQGSKVDVWSAGVTLLYLMIGRTPFVGDPEQNVKDIAKLRGCEDLWEVAKLHNRESSFPVELFDIQSLPSMELQEWCEVNTKRPDFLELIPRSLFDLVDKCLTVNPRRRISAEEALRHEFFTSCHEDLRKQRLLRRGLSLDSGSPHHSHGPV